MGGRGSAGGSLARSRITSDEGAKAKAARQGRAIKASQSRR